MQIRIHTHTYTYTDSLLPKSGPGLVYPDSSPEKNICMYICVYISPEKITLCLTQPNVMHEHMPICVHVYLDLFISWENQTSMSSKAEYYAWIHGDMGTYVHAHIHIHLPDSPPKTGGHVPGRSIYNARVRWYIKSKVYIYNVWVRGYIGIHTYMHISLYIIIECMGGIWIHTHMYMHTCPRFLTVTDSHTWEVFFVPVKTSNMLYTTFLMRELTKLLKPKCSTAVCGTSSTWCRALNSYAWPRLKIWVYACVYIYIYIYIYMYVCMYVCMRVYTHTCI